MKNPLAGWVARLPVRVHLKLLAALLAIVAVQMALGAVALRTLTAVNGRGDALVLLQRKIAAYRQLQHDVTTQLYSATSALVLQDRHSLDATLRQLSQFGYDMDRLQFVAQDEAELLGQIRGQYDRFVAVVTRAVGSVRDGRLREAQATLRGEAGPLADSLERATNRLVNKAEADMVAAVEASRREYRIARFIVVACAAASILLAVVLGYALSGSLITPVRQIAAHLSRIASGDFSQHVEVANRDELGSLAASVNRMRDELGRLYRQVQQRTVELDAALEQQTAISDILRVISSSPTDVTPVLQAVADRAARLCEGKDSRIFLAEGNQLKYVAGFGDIAAFEVGGTLAINRDSVSGRSVVDGKPVHIADLASASPDEYPLGREHAMRLGHRTTLAVPLLREGKALGTILLRRAEVRPFTERQIALVQTFADQAAIAIENVRLFNETKESLEQQTAISDILRVISSSPTDVQPVLQAVAERAASLCEGKDAHIMLVEGNHLKVAAGFGEIPTAEASTLRPISRDWVSGRSVVDGQAIHVPDLASASLDEYPLGRELAMHLGHRTTLAVPLLREGKALGAILLRRAEVRPFTERQIALVQIFADQAAIAIENVRLFNETKAALEQQTAISDILRVISSSPTDVQPVLQAVADRAARLCDSENAGILLVEGDKLVWAQASVGMQVNPGTLPIDRQSVNGRAVVDGKPVHVADLASASPDEYPLGRELAIRFGHRTTLAVPLLREGKALGTIDLRRMEVRPFTERQIALVQTFADQAAIAIENVRLFNETKEALEQQTAISDILRVISSSPTDVQPVLQAVAERAARLCNSADARLFLIEASQLKLLAGFGEIPAFEFGGTRTINRDSVAARSVVDGKPVHVADLASAPADEYPVSRELALRLGYRTTLAVPLMREGKALGAIGLHRAEVRPFTERQIALVQTFADQAAIAIENVRLFNATKESLEQQTAISDILRVISSSPTDVTPVLQAVAERAARLCEGKNAGIWLVEGDKLVFSQVGVGDLARADAGMVLPIDRQSVNGRAVVDAKSVHVADLASASPDEYPLGRELAIRFGHRTILAVPLLREGRALGTINLRKMVVRPFTDRQIALVQTFADQAAIAIENVRLFNETKAALEQQTAISDILRVISSSPTDVQPVLQAVAERAARLCEGKDARIMLVEGSQLKYVAGFGDIGPFEVGGTLAISRDSVSGRSVVDGSPVHVADLASASPDEYPLGREHAMRLGHRTTLAVPLLREGKALGTILLRRMEARPFSERQIALVQTFANQAAIAIANVRLFHEIQDKSLQLEIANRHKSEFLANMSHELRTPLNAIIGFSEVLIERMFGELNEKQADYLNDIHTSGKHLLSLINDILDLAKIEAGRMELEVAAFSVPGALESALTLVRERAQHHGLSLSLAVDPAVDTIEGDERKFKQIVLNLLSNAVKFTPDGGRVAVRARRAGERVAVSVEDTGIGIAPADQELVFEEFRQAGGLYSNKAEGTGLGLALARRFVEMHGGRLRLESTPGAGSTFTFELPVSR